MYSDGPTHRSLLCICVSNGILYILVTVYEDVKNAHTFWHRDNVLSQRGCLLQLLYTMRDNIRWNGAMREQMWIFCCGFCLKELWRWGVCMHSLICSCISLWAFAESRGLNRQKKKKTPVFICMRLIAYLFIFFIGISDGWWII